MGASGLRVAIIGCARISVVAVGRLAADADSVVARIVCCAGIAVFAWCIVVFIVEDASGFRIAAVFRARVFVVARVADIFVFTSGFRIAAIVCTSIVVIAVKRLFADALTVVANIDCCADIAVVALSGVVRVNASSDRVAAISRAYVVVGTRRADIGVNASYARIAVVVSARITVVAISRVTALALAVVADIAGGTGVTVVTGVVVVSVYASGLWITAVVGAAIVVVAVEKISFPTRS
jgi:hypothetical protein